MTELLGKFLADPDFALKAILAFGGLIAFVVGLNQYRRAQLWKRKEFIGSELRAFLADPTVRNVLLMIDWSARPIPFDPAAPRESWPLVTREGQIAALQPHTLPAPDLSATNGRVRRYTEVEAQIRDAYDAFLDGLERLDSFAESGLFERNELLPYLCYWLQNVTRNDGPTEDRRWRLTFFAYVQFYRFPGVQRLFRATVGDISVRGPVWTRLRDADPALAGALESATSDLPDPPSAGAP